MPIDIEKRGIIMAITPPKLGDYKSPISTELMYQFYDNKAITPQIRAALQKKQQDADAESGSDAAPGSKFGPAARVNITDQIVRMNMAGSKDKTEEAETSKRPSRFDALEYAKANVAERQAEANKEKDAALKGIADKIAAEEEAKKAAEKGSEEETAKEEG
ncbi:MAG: hypothetical protein FWH22_05930 [Fibromonadales bacterium]|nr:hypothetical protein [Fibromonadales bacterium]